MFQPAPHLGQLALVVMAQPADTGLALLVEGNPLAQVIAFCLEFSVQCRVSLGNNFSSASLSLTSSSSACADQSGLASAMR